jgi:hypothetical protein
MPLKGQCFKMLIKSLNNLNVIYHYFTKHLKTLMAKLRKKTLLLKNKLNAKLKIIMNY